ncbi:MAG: hypothetical protein Q8M20_15465 [Rhodocyclaceae bacterium]|nr:hypothetical protein [Rhodocyclaceae bacterium]
MIAVGQRRDAEVYATAEERFAMTREALPDVRNSQLLDSSSR